MLVLKGSEAAARIKKEVQEMVEGLGGHVPTAAIVRVGERPDDLSYERNVMKKIASFGMEARSFAFPESISEGEFQAEFQKINDDPSIDGILLFCPLPRHMNGRTFEELIRPEKDLDGISPVNRARIFAGEKDGFAPCTAEAVIEILKTYHGGKAGRGGGPEHGGGPAAVHAVFKGKRHGHCLSYENGGSESRMPGGGYPGGGGR